MSKLSCCWSSCGGGIDDFLRCFFCFFLNCWFKHFVFGVCFQQTGTKTQIHFWVRSFFRWKMNVDQLQMYQSLFSNGYASHGQAADGYVSVALKDSHVFFSGPTKDWYTPERLTAGTWEYGTPGISESHLNQTINGFRFQPLIFGGVNPTLKASLGSAHADVEVHLFHFSSWEGFRGVPSIRRGSVKRRRWWVKGGGNSKIFGLSPRFSGEMMQFCEYFSNGLKPTTSFVNLKYSTGPDKSLSDEHF